MIHISLVGHETTAGALNFAIRELSKRPELQARLRDEVLEFGRDLSYDDIQKLELLDAVTKEAYVSFSIQFPDILNCRHPVLCNLVPRFITHFLSRFTDFAYIRPRLRLNA